MYLSDRDLVLALDAGQLIVDPRPTEIDTTSIDLHLDTIEEAKIWDVELFALPFTVELLHYAVQSRRARVREPMDLHWPS